MRIGEINSIVYTCGYFIRKCLRQHKCKLCLEYADANKSKNVRLNSQFYCYYKAYEFDDNNAFGNLYMPHDNFINYVEKLSRIFFEKIGTIILSTSVISQLVTEFSKVDFSHPCPDFPKSYFLKLFSRVTLFYTLKFANKKFKAQPAHKKVVILKHD